MAQSELRYEGPHQELFELLPPDQQAELLEIITMLNQTDGFVVTVGNIKGGASKSTTSVYLALLLGFSGHQVLLVDADVKNLSCLLWQSATTEWPSNVKVVNWAGERTTPTEMAKKIREAQSTFRYVVVDTSPHATDYLAAALSVTDEFIVPVRPNPLDTQQLPKSVDLAGEVEAMRGGAPIYTTVLFTQAKRNTVSLRDQFQYAREQGYAVFEGRAVDEEDDVEPFAITMLERYAQAAYTVPDDFGEYPFVLRQLVEGRLEEGE